MPAEEFNNFIDELKNIILSSGQSLTGADVTQISKAIANYVINGQFFTDSGVANAYLLTVVGSKFNPTSYTNGFTAMFKVGNSNTGTSTVNVAGLGVKTIKKNNGADDLSSGDLQMGQIVEVVYDASGDYFELTRTEFIAGDFLRRDQTSNVTVGYTTSAFALGNSGTGTVTPLIRNGHIQTLIINGNFTLAAPTDVESGIIEIRATVGSPGGFTINTSAYTVLENGYNSTSGKENLIRIIKIGSTSYISIRAVPFVSSGTNVTTFNAIINGGFDVWQRGTNFSNVGASVYTADRWFNSKSSTTAQYTFARSSDVPSVDVNTPKLNYSLQVTINTADTSANVATISALTQRIEGYNFRPVAQKTFVCSFWVKGSVTGTYCVSFTSSNDDRCFISEYTINSPNTWERKTVTVTASPISGTWFYDNRIGLEVNFAFYVGSNFQGAANTWLTSARFATSNQTNLLANNGATFFITAVQIEVGTQATPFLSEDYPDTFDRCLRYYDNDIPQIHTGATVGNPLSTGHFISWRVIKRATPTILASSVNVVLTDGLIDLTQTAPLIRVLASSENGAYLELGNINPAPVNYRTYVYRFPSRPFFIDAEL